MRKYEWFKFKILKMEQSSISVNTTDTNYLSTNFGLIFRKKKDVFSDD